MRPWSFSGIALEAAMPSRNPNQTEALLRTIEKQALLSNRFSNIRRISPSGGDGSFSLLVTADDKHSKERVVLKFFDPAQRTDAYRWKCFQREPELLQKFSGHRDILQCVSALDEFTEVFTNQFGFGIPVPFAFYGLEVAKEDVGRAILRDGWKPRSKLEAFRAMCRAVQRVHARGIAHRDLKPSNFMIMADRTVRLADFGTARELADAAVMPVYNAPPGDLRYAAPEILAALHDADPRFALSGDIYSLGAILFELFTGTPLVFSIFDWGTLSSWQSSLSSVNRTDRVRIYNSLIGSVADSRPLPSLASYGDVAPKASLETLDHLYRRLACIDYRSRLADFETIFMLVNRCALIMDNEMAYRRWRDQRLLWKAKALSAR